MEVDSHDHIMISFEIPQQLTESSIEDDTPRQYDDENMPTVTTYEMIEDGSQKGKEKLADSEGYTYTVKKRRANGDKVWTCSVRNKSMWCKASVLQKADGFTRGSQSHIHPAQLGAATATRISTAVKRIAATEIFTSAAEIVNKVPSTGIFIIILYIYMHLMVSPIIPGEIAKAKSKLILFSLEICFGKHI